MRRMRFFASRNAREILRDPISVGFGVAFPILLLLLLSFLNRHIPAEAHMTLFEPEQLAPGVSVFSLSFLALFSALLLSRDRSSALILRLYASPLTGRDFILGYLLPMLPMALAQTLVCLLAAIPLGLPVSWRILACTAVNVPFNIRRPKNMNSSIWAWRLIASALSWRFNAGTPSISFAEILPHALIYASISLILL